MLDKPPLPPGKPPTVKGKGGKDIGKGHRVKVGGARGGTGVVDAVDPDAGKIWVRYDSMGTEYPRVFWTDAQDADVMD